MESTVAALLLVTSSVVLSCIVVVYAVDMAQQSISPDSPNMRLISQIESSLNETAFFNGTLLISPSPTPMPTMMP